MVKNTALQPYDFSQIGMWNTNLIHASISSDGSTIYIDGTGPAVTALGYTDWWSVEVASGETPGLNPHLPAGYIYNGAGQVVLAPKLPTLHVPGSKSTTALGENTVGSEVVGKYLDAKGVQHGFLYEDGSYFKLDVPNLGSGVSLNTAIFGISDTGKIVGTYDGLITHGIVFVAQQGSFDQFGFGGQIGQASPIPLGHSGGGSMAMMPHQPTPILLHG